MKAKGANRNEKQNLMLWLGSHYPWRNDEGFVIMGMKYFLLNANSLEF